MDAVESLHGKGDEDPCCVDIVAHTIRSRPTHDGQVIVSKGSMVSGSCMSNMGSEIDLLRGSPQEDCLLQRKQETP